MNASLLLKLLKEAAREQGESVLAGDFELIQTALVEGEPGRKRAQNYCTEIKVRYQEWQSAVADPRYPLVLTIYTFIEQLLQQMEENNGQ